MMKLLSGKEHQASIDCYAVRKNESQTLSAFSQPTTLNALLDSRFGTHLTHDIGKFLNCGWDFVGNDPPIHQTIAAGVVPKLIELASHPNEDILVCNLDEIVSEYCRK